MENYLNPDPTIARARKKYLGFGHLADAAYEEILKAALEEYREYPSAAVRHSLTWPEFIIVMAKRKGVISTLEGLASMIDCMESIGTIGGMTRTNWGKRQYLSWDGWQTL